jgi:hypothetical protein
VGNLSECSVLAASEGSQPDSLSRMMSLLRALSSITSAAVAVELSTNFMAETP